MSLAKFQVRFSLHRSGYLLIRKVLLDQPIPRIIFKRDHQDKALLYFYPLSRKTNNPFDKILSIQPTSTMNFVTVGARKPEGYDVATSRFCAKDLETAKANIIIDEGIAYSVAYLAMLRAGRAFMLLKGYHPADGYQHKTAVEFMSHVLPEEYRNIMERFDRMRRKCNIFTYEIDVTISRTEADSAFDTAVKFVDLIKDAIKENSPQGHFKF